MEIESRIQAIIDRRRGLGAYQGHGRVDSVNHQKQVFEAIKAETVKFGNYRNLILQQIGDKEGVYYEMSLQDPTFESRIVNCSPDAVLKNLEQSIAECDSMIKRFSRESINISVIGRARQGKSTLLQSISGLSNEIIPASDGADCTGAKSVILNRKGRTSARIIFYTEEELIACVRKYLKELNSDSVPLYSASSIPSIDLEAIEKRMERSQKSQSKLDHLSKYVLHYNEYAGYIGTVKENITDEAEIRRYVAQYDVNDNATFIYLAVKEAQISTEFPIKDAGRIMLVDTIGLGDTALGIKDKMLETLFNDSDAAVILRRPDAKGDALRVEDDELLDLISDKLSGRSADKWLFYLLNVSKYLDNEKTGKTIYKQLSDRIAKGSGATEFIKMIDCHDKEAVKNELCLPLLNSLVDNLDTIDGDIINLSNKVFQKCFLSYMDLVGKIQKVTYGGINKVSSIGAEFDGLFDKLQLSPELKELNNKYKAQKGKSETSIQEEISKVLKTIPRHCPNEEEIIEKLRYGGRESYPGTVYTFYADNVRSHISDDFEAINENTIVSLQERLKLELIDILQNEEYGRLGVIPLMNYKEADGPIAWLRAFIDEKLQNYPLLSDAFSSIYDYRLNIEGLLDYEVNQSLECLDPESKAFYAIDFKGLSEEEAAEAIEQNILGCMTKIGATLKANIADRLEKIPNNSFDARIRKFREKIIFSEEGNRELKNFYRDNCMLIWKKEMTAIVNSQTALGDWNELSSGLVRYNNNSQFEIKL